MENPTIMELLTLRTKLTCQLPQACNAHFNALQANSQSCIEKAAFAIAEIKRQIKEINARIATEEGTA